MDKQQAIEILQERLDKIPELRKLTVGTVVFKEWKNDTETTIEHILPSKLHKFTQISYIPTPTIAAKRSWQEACKKQYLSGLNNAEALLKSLINEVGLFGYNDNKPITNKEPLVIIENTCRKFRTVARQLRDRYAGRATIEIKDEYDVQDLLHGLLRLHFDDIRDEEWTPSYAGKCSRVDFLLKDEQIVIEVKKTRDKLGNKELGEELIIDIARYKVHTDCKTLICFVYDPEGRITNPHGLISDLEKSKELNVKVYIE